MFKNIPEIDKAARLFLLPTCDKITLKFKIIEEKQEYIEEKDPLKLENFDKNIDVLPYKKFNSKNHVSVLFEKFCSDLNDLKILQIIIDKIKKKISDDVNKIQKILLTEITDFLKNNKIEANKLVKMLQKDPNLNLVDWLSIRCILDIYPGYELE